MRRSSKKWLGLLTIGTLFQATIPGGCAEYTAEFLIQTFDFCAVLNCQSGTFINFWDPSILYVDCL